jgi:hypothetical protein
MTQQVEGPFPKPNVSEPSETKAKEEAVRSEFTPPPTTLREAVFGKATEDAGAVQASAGEPATEETPTGTIDEATDADERIEELEAEKGAVSSLMARLEEMKASGTIEQELYDKLKKKYTGEIDKTNNRIEKLVQNERKKPSKK